MLRLKSKKFIKKWKNQKLCHRWSTIIIRCVRKSTPFSTKLQNGTPTQSLKAKNILMPVISKHHSLSRIRWCPRMISVSWSLATDTECKKESLNFGKWLFIKMWKLLHASMRSSNEVAIGQCTNTFRRIMKMNFKLKMCLSLKLYRRLRLIRWWLE